MGLYSKPSLELLCQQLIRDNPALANRATPDAFGVKGSPVAKQVNGRNTQITLAGRPGKGFSGELTVYYDRVNLSQLFRSSTQLIEVPRTAKTYGDLLPAFNAAHGLNLQPSDIQLPDRPIVLYATPVTVPIVTTPGALCFTGGTNITYRAAPIGYYPNSGPGEKYLRAGNELNGYFGSVSSEQLFGSDYFAQRLYGDTGWPSLNAVMWLKFMLNGKVVFIPGRGLFYTDWQRLYKAGAIFGTSGPGRRPQTLTGDVPQELYISRTDGDKSYYFKVYTPFYQEGVDIPSMAQPPSPTSIFSLTKKLGTYSTPGEWGQLNGTEGYLGTEVWTQHSDMYSKAYYIAMDGGMMRNTDLFISADWAPILELIDPATNVLPPTAVTYAQTKAFPPLVVQSKAAAPIKPVNLDLLIQPAPLPLVGSAKPTNPPIKPVTLDAPVITIPRPLVVKASNTNGVIAPPKILGVYSTAPHPLAAVSRSSSKTPLANTQAELDGFK